MIQVFCANHGTCCFPRFTECPIQQYTYNAEIRRREHEAQLETIKQVYDNNRFVANPVAEGGRTDGK